MAEEPSRFLSRWARRKTDVLQGKVVSEPVAVAKTVLPEPVETEVRLASEQDLEKSPELSLEDVKLLTKDSDFKPFMAQNVGSDVRNAAMKKLFADPHFNVMDGLDIYIDDYSKSDPIPEAMLRAMTSSKFLKLFDQEEDADKDSDKDSEKDSEKNGDATSPRDYANTPSVQTVAQSNQQTNLPEPESVPRINSSQPESLTDSEASQQDHDHSHLRLQPDHAATAPQAGRGTE